MNIGFIGNTTRESLWLGSLSRSSCPEVFYKKGVLKNFSKFTGKPQDIKYLSCRTSLLNCVPCVPAHQSGLRANVLASQHDLRPNVQKRANFLFLLVNMPYNVPIWRAEWRANFSNWRANVQKRASSFQTFLLCNDKANFYTLFLYKKIYVILDIIVLHIMCT